MDSDLVTQARALSGQGCLCAPGEAVVLADRDCLKGSDGRGRRAFHVDVVRGAVHYQSRARPELERRGYGIGPSATAVERPDDPRNLRRRTPQKVEGDIEDPVRVNPQRRVATTAGIAQRENHVSPSHPAIAGIGEEALEDGGVGDWRIGGRIVA